MVFKKTDTTTYLMRDVPKDLWAQVKAAAYADNMSIKDWLNEVIRDAIVRRKTDGKKGN